MYVNHDEENTPRNNPLFSEWIFWAVSSFKVMGNPYKNFVGVTSVALFNHYAWLNTLNLLNKLI